MAERLSEVALRRGTDQDGLVVAAIMAEAYSEHTGCVFDLEAELPELLAPATAYVARGGEIWVAVENDRRVIGSAAFAVYEESAFLEKLYVCAKRRGLGIASMLCSLIEERVRASGHSTLSLWTDTRFAAAHAFYDRRGYLRSPLLRQLPDLSYSVEFFYRRSL